LAKQGAAIGTNAASPFIGDANASVVGGAGQSVAGAAVGAATMAVGFGTGNPLFVAQGMAMLGKELVSLPKNLHDWSEALIQSQFALKEWSPAVAGIAAQAQIRDILRMQESGEATKKSLEAMSKEWQQYKDYWRPTKDWWTNRLNEWSKDTASVMRGFSPDEKKLLEDTEGFQTWQKEQGHGFLRRLLWADQDIETWIEETRKKHPEKFHSEHSSPHAIFEDWMRQWQNGKFRINSNRPVPK